MLHRILGNHPFVVLKVKSALLQSPHPLNCHRNSESHEIVELQIIRFIEAGEEALNPPKL